jgi:hypothetical protein
MTSSPTDHELLNAISVSEADDRATFNQFASAEKDGLGRGSARGRRFRTGSQRIATYLPGWLARPD